MARYSEEKPTNQFNENLDEQDYIIFQYTISAIMQTLELDRFSLAFKNVFFIIKKRKQKKQLYPCL